MFGYSGISWHSVISPAMPPRPIVDPLAGGYRRIPVAQIGADIFCDTRIISCEIADLAAKPELAMENCDIEVQKFVDHVDFTIFAATVRSGKPLRSLSLLARNFLPWNVMRFLRDRAGIAQNSSLPRMSQAKAQQMIREHHQNMEQRLQSSEFLFGDTPGIADFSAYHLLWFSKRIRGGNPLADHPNAQAWLERMFKFGHGEKHSMSKSAAFAAASENQARIITDDLKNDPMIGENVSIGPDDYAKDRVSGVLVGSGDLRWILARETDQFGTINVHFPKSGFTLES